MTKKSEPRTDTTLKNFEKVVQTLTRFISTPAEDDRDRAGVIQAFEFCYELAWKSLKKIAEEQGLEAPTPLQAFQAGFQMGLIHESEHQLWLDMKATRNLTSHTYSEELSLQVFHDVQKTYAPALKVLVERIKKK